MGTLGNSRRAAWQMALVFGAALALVACGDDDGAGEGGSAGSAGEGGSAGTAGEGGSAGSAGEGGSAGTAGEGGSAGTAGEGGSAGTAGEGGSAGTAGEGGSAGTAGVGGTGGSACTVTPGTTWDAPDFAANAAAELVLRGQLQALNTRMQRGEDETPTATVLADLTALFEAGTPSLRDAMTTTYAEVVDDVFALFIPTVGQVLDPATTWDPTPEPTDVGGRLCGPAPMPTSGCWNMSAGGVDLRQVLEKGAYQAAQYRQAYLRASGQVTPATIDQIAALFGANDAFDVDGTNVHASNYAKGMGFYGPIRGHLIAAKAYAGEGTSCQAELNTELNAALLAWEQSQLARFVYYANRAQTLFVAGTATVAQNAEALHWLGEGLGLVYGFKGLPNNARVITDEEIDEVLMLMKMPNVESAALYQLLVGNSDDIDDIEAVFDLIQDVYGFTDAQMTNQFRVMTPTPG